MAIVAALVVVPLGLLFLLSGLVVNLIQVGDGAIVVEREGPFGIRSWIWLFDLVLLVIMSVIACYSRLWGPWWFLGSMYISNL